jgi:hypothetical protein
MGCLSIKNDYVYTLPGVTKKGATGKATFSDEAKP